MDIQLKNRTLPADKGSILLRAKERLAEVYGDRLRGLILYGSEARGEAQPESDIDLLVLLDGPIALGTDLRTIVDALYPLQLEVERPIHATPADPEDYEAGEFALYRKAKREGIAL